MTLFKKILPAEILTLPVLVAALGYFIDVYDIWIFGANRAASLRDIGVAEADIFDTGIMLFNLQMAGLFLGGFVFGILGDKFGRKRMMFISIITYSVATLLNGFVDSVPAYAFFRFIAGFGLAGELGLAVTLISEMLPKDKRGYGTGIIVGFGVSGALAAALMAHYVPWRYSYIAGGVAGLILLFFRMRVAESGMFEKTRDAGTQALGSLRMLITSRARLIKFCYCVFLMLPIWYAAAILVTFGPELIQSEYGLTVAVTTLMIWFNLFLALGDFAAAWISQIVRSRKRVLAAFLTLAALMTGILLLSPAGLNEQAIIAVYIGIALGSGCWVLGATVAAESFGTNLRATIATAVPNFSRAGTIPMTLAIAQMKPHIGPGNAALCVGALVFALALLAAWRLPETYAKDLDYVEE